MSIRRLFVEKKLPTKEEVDGLEAEAKRLAMAAKKSGDPADHKRAMKAFDEASRLALRAKMDERGDELKGQAHDHWKASKKVKVQK